MFVLVINPGSTSTKFSVFADQDNVFERVLRHSTADLAGFENVIAQYNFRKNVILDALDEAGYSLDRFDAIVGRGGLLRPLKGGTYRVNEAMLADLKSCKYGEHASNLGAILAAALALEIDKPAYIVDPVVVDEMVDLARLSGHPLIERKSIFHALNQKAVARVIAAKYHRAYQDMNLIVAHMGGGISVGLHRHGATVDVNNALDGDGPFTPERAGSLPASSFAGLCYSGDFTVAEIKKLLKGKGGLVAYLNTNDAREVVQRIEDGDDYAQLVLKAMAYQVAKEIGALAAANKGAIDAIILTGGLAYEQKYLIPWIIEGVSFIAPVEVLPGEFEMDALAAGAIRVLNKEEVANVY